MTRAAYVWSKYLQAACDQLPANLGRSSMVHDLIWSLGLLDSANSMDGSKRVDAEGSGNEDESEESEEGKDHDQNGKAAPGKKEEVEELASQGGRARIEVVAPDPVLGDAPSLKKYHDPKYVDYLLSEYNEPEEDENADLLSDGDSVSSSGSRPRKRIKTTEHGLEHDCPRFPALAEYSTLVASSTLTACRRLTSGSSDVAINWDGGRHHALRNRASGFCYVADAVLGIMALVRDGKGRAGGRARVMYLDLDLHYGDGVAQAFLSPRDYSQVHADDQSPDGADKANGYSENGATGKRRANAPPRPPQVLTLSIHHSSPIFFPPTTPLSGLPSPSTPSPFTLSVPLAAYPRPSTYARVWKSAVERVREAFQPDYVVIQLGADGLPNDPVGQYGAWSVEGKGGVRWCLERAKSWGLPMCVLGGGGYDHANTARAWAVATAVLTGQDLPSTTDVPDHTHFAEYKPSFTLEVTESNVADENTDETLSLIDETFRTISYRINRIMQTK